MQPGLNWKLHGFLGYSTFTQLSLFLVTSLQVQRHCEAYPAKQGKYGCWPEDSWSPRPKDRGVKNQIKCTRMKQALSIRPPANMAAWPRGCPSGIRRKRCRCGWLQVRAPCAQRGKWHSLSQGKITSKWASFQEGFREEAALGFGRMRSISVSREAWEVQSAFHSGPSPKDETGTRRLILKKSN